MADIMKRQFNVLELSGENFLEWSVDWQINLKDQGLEHAIANEVNDTIITTTKTASEQEKARVVVFIRHHLSDSLKSEYLRMDDPKILWESLHERFGHHKAVLLPKAELEWSSMRFQDFKSVSDYNSTMFKIMTLLNYIDSPRTDAMMIEKTLSTFNASDIIISQQYRYQKLQKYSELISLLLVAEQNKNILWNNHNSRSVGNKALHEANAIESSQPFEANVTH